MAADFDVSCWTWIYLYLSKFDLGRKRLEKKAKEKNLALLVLIFFGLISLYLTQAVSLFWWEKIWLL